MKLLNYEVFEIEFPFGNGLQQRVGILNYFIQSLHVIQRQLRSALECLAAFGDRYHVRHLISVIVERIAVTSPYLHRLPWTITVRTLHVLIIVIWGKHARSIATSTALHTNFNETVNFFKHFKPPITKILVSIKCSFGFIHERTVFLSQCGSLITRDPTGGISI